MNKHEFALMTRANLDAMDITSQIADMATREPSGLAIIGTSHTTVGLVLAPGDDPMRRDFIQLAKRWPARHGPFEHFEEDNPNAEAHLLSAFAGTKVTLVVEDGNLELGKYQRILLLEFDGPRKRTVTVHFFGLT